MIGQVKKDNGKTNIFPFIIQRIYNDLETDTTIDSITKRKLKTELYLLEKINGYCDIPEIGRTIDQVKDDIDNYICTFLSPFELKMALSSNDILNELQKLRTMLNTIFENEIDKETKSDG